MSGWFGIFESGTWALSVLLQICLLILLLYRRNFLQFPAFTSYIAAAILQGVSTFLAYRYLRGSAQFLFYAAWMMQGLVALLRMIAVVEVCRHVFGAYAGIWVLISRSLITIVALAAAVALGFGGGNLGLKILHADRAAGFALAAGIVGIFFFARYYRVEAREPMRSMAVGFFLYSCFVVLNDSVLETLLAHYGNVWNALSMWAFVGSLVVWCAAFRFAYATEFKPELLPGGIYQNLSPALNERLKRLNDRLGGLGQR